MNTKDLQRLFREVNAGSTDPGYVAAAIQATATLWAAGERPEPEAAPAPAGPDYVDDGTRATSAIGAVVEGTGSWAILTGQGGRRFAYSSAGGNKRLEFRCPVLAPSRCVVRLLVPRDGNEPVSDSSRTIVLQVHGGDNDGKNPVLSLEYFLRQGEWRVYTGADPHVPYASVFRAPLVLDEEVEFEFRRVFWDPSAGALEVLFNGEVVHTVDGPTLHTGQVKPPYLKYGIYYPSAVNALVARRSVVFRKLEVWK